MKCFVSFAYTDANGHGFANMIAVLGTSTLYAQGVQAIEQQVAQHVVDHPDKFGRNTKAVLLNIVPLE